MKQLNYLFLAVLALAVTACQQDPETPVNLPDAPTLSVDETSVTRVSMLVNGSFGHDLTDITSYGVELSDALFESGGEIRTLTPQEVGPDGYALGISGLSPNETYYLRAFISNGHSKMYSSVVTQKTPETSVASVSDVTLSADGAYMTATLEDDGGRSVEEVGFVWGTVNDRRSLRREKRYPATLDNNGKTFSLPLSLVGTGTHYLLAYAEDDKEATGFGLIPFAFVVDEPVPEPPTPGISPNKYLTFTSEGTTTVSSTNNAGNTPILYYSNNSRTWSLWDYSELTFTANQPLYICGDNPEGFSHWVSDEEICYSQFVSSGDSFSVTGDIMSILNMDTDLLAIPSPYCFYSLFKGCSNLTSAPLLPATELAEWCYAVMFAECTSLTSAPELLATHMATGCYFSMFSSCSSLVIPPSLPAMELAPRCYLWMFGYCTSLQSAPALPAMNLDEWCYMCMFKGCTNLINAPELPASKLADASYYAMFYECTNLNYIKCLATDITEEDSTNSWLSRVASTGTFVKSPQMNDWPTGTSGIPEGWTVVDDGSVAVTGITLDQESLTLKVGESAIIMHQVIPASATNKNVTWSSDHPEFASVNAGVVTGVSAGTAVITVTTVDGGFSASCPVTVKRSTNSGQNEDFDFENW